MIEMNDFFKEVLEANDDSFTILIFNIYEDVGCYSMDAEYDWEYDSSLAIRRNDPIEISDKKIKWYEVLDKIKPIMEDFYSKHKDSFKNIKILAYGFVDGNLYFLKRDID